jgi:hypothetical protein
VNSYASGFAAETIIKMQACPVVQGRLSWGQEALFLRVFLRTQLRQKNIGERHCLMYLEAH